MVMKRLKQKKKEMTIEELRDQVLMEQQAQRRKLVENEVENEEAHEGKSISSRECREN